MRHPALAALRPAAAACLLLCPAAVRADDRAGLSRIPGNLLRSVREEARWEGAGTLLGSLASVVALRNSDKGGFDGDLDVDFSQHQRLGRRWADAGAWAGDGAVLLLLTGAFYASGRLLHDDKVRDFGQMGFEALTLSTVQTYALKLTARRERPDGSDHYSFPSGHASTAFALASVAASEWGWAAGAPAMGLAGFIGFTRMEKRKHYLSDVVFGMGLGIASGRAVWKAHHRKDPDRVSAAPVLFPGGAGLAVRF
ncbi:MAG: phosphatase PAP2 family protein [Elusimicrobia bacterium]|nr:phosphatase PAP2 family protein [Elusimicrobiota bacterium]